MNAIYLWRLSVGLHRRGMPRLARLCKAVNFLLFKALLEPDVDLRGPVYLAHTGMGIVVHGSTIIEPEVVIWQNVLIGASHGKHASGHGVRIRSEAVIGPGATVICPPGQTLTIGRGARISAGAIVRSDVPDGGIVVPDPSPVTRINPPERWPLP